MSLTVSLLSVDLTRRMRRLKYKAVPNNDAYTAGGDTVNLLTASNPSMQPHGCPDKVPSVDEVEFTKSLVGNIPQWVVGSTLANAKIALYGSAATDHAATTYSAGEQADYIIFVITQSIGKSK